MSITQREKDWVAALPVSVREALSINDTSLNDFAGNARRAEALSKLCFRRAVEGMVDLAKSSGELHTVESGDDFGSFAISSVDNEEVNARLDLAMKSNKYAADLKEKRLHMIREYADVTDVPQPAALTFEIIEAPREMQVERLRALGFYEEADAMHAEEEEYEHEGD